MLWLAQAKANSFSNGASLQLRSAAKLNSTDNELPTISLAGHMPLTIAYNVAAKAECPVLTVRGGSA